MNQSRNWIFTHNFIAGMLPYDIGVDLTGFEYAKYFIYQLEMGSNGTLHQQGYLELTRSVRLSALKKLLPRAHWEPRRGSQQEAIDYCSKLDTRIEEPVIYGTPSRQKTAAKTFTDRINKYIWEDRKTLKEIAHEDPGLFVLRYSGLDRIIALRDAEIPLEFQVRSFSDFTIGPIEDWSVSHVLFGPTEVGKTSYAIAHFKRPLVVTHVEDLKKFDVKFHDGLIFDDMSFNHWPRTSQIHIVDQELARTIHCRYGNAVIPAKTKKIFTTNILEDLFIEDPAISRRYELHRISYDIRKREIINDNGVITQFLNNKQL